MIGREHLSGSAHSRLHFVNNEHDAVFVADSSEFFNERFRCRNVTAFALHDFENDSGNLFGRCRRFKKTIFDPIYTIARDGFFIGRQIIGKMSEFIWIWNVNDIESLPHKS